MLYLVATPIGNLKDFSFRAVETLNLVEYILCEDTRTSLVLLNNYEIKKPLYSYHKFNEKEKVDKIIRDLEEGKDILFDIEWQGTQQIAENAREDLVSVFILPPSMAELERRLFSRAQDSEEVVRQRMATAAAEMSHWNEYDYVIVNIDFEESVKNPAISKI